MRIAMRLRLRSRPEKWVAVDLEVEGHYFGLRAIRKGQWKAVYMTPWRGKDAWELCDIDKDPGEVDDRAGFAPEVIEKMVQHWNLSYRRREYLILMLHSMRLLIKGTLSLENK